MENEEDQIVDFNSDLRILYVNGILWHISSHDTIHENIEECLRMKIYPSEDEHNGKGDHIVLVTWGDKIIEEDKNYIHNYNK